ncbi:MAG: hypothetical protein HWQ35_02695 [Nostoc sp. NMS1]|nr:MULTISPECIES: hypothetical protein [unclassified Nostoc]MBN3905518.1 hypothetical protein [Nostoc sp. NMS1]MBN3994061.1 hypothetical protein [Nostoc sp. NMS2]
MLQPNDVLAIPHSHGATELIHCADNRTAPALPPQFWVVCGYDLAHFA